MSRIINELRAAQTAALHLGDTAEDEYAWGYAAGVQAAIDLINKPDESFYGVSLGTPLSEEELKEELRGAVERINDRAASDFTLRKFRSSLAHGY